MFLSTKSICFILVLILSQDDIFTNSQSGNPYLPGPGPGRGGPGGLGGGGLGGGGLGGGGLGGGGLGDGRGIDPRLILLARNNPRLLQLARENPQLAEQFLRSPQGLAALRDPRLGISNTNY